MRWVYLAVIILFAAATIVFALQNFEIVTMSFLGINARVPLALLVAVAYVLGAATGGSLGIVAICTTSVTAAIAAAIRKAARQPSRAPI